MTLPPKMEHFRISQREIPIYCLWQCNFDYKIAGRVGDPPLQKGWLLNCNLSIHRAFRGGEQGGDAAAQGGGLGGIGGAELIDPLGRGGLGILQRLQIAA